MIQSLLYRYRLNKLRQNWRRKNYHNETNLINDVPIDSVKVGKKTYGPIECLWLTKHDVKIYIGNYVSIGPKVKFLVGGVHDYKRISTWPFQSKVYEELDNNKDDNSLDIIIEDDVWIGYDAIIMSGVRIGKGSVIGARSIVAKSVPPYSVFIGNKVVKKRFSPDVIEKIKDVDFEILSHKKGDSYQLYCQTQVTENNIETILKVFQNS